MKNWIWIGFWVCLTGVACDEHHAIDWDGKLGSFQVDLTQGERGTPDGPINYTTAGLPFTMTIRALSAGEGDKVVPFRGWVRVSSRPGETFVISGPTVAGNHVYIKDGVAEGIAVSLVNGFGETRIWVEDVGYEPPPPGKTPLCADGCDNDGDSLTDYPDDPGCLDSTDNSESVGTGATGVSQAIYIQYPTIADVQGRGKESPFIGESVTVNRGDMVVTRVTTDGMYVTDIADTGSFNHVYLYNFNTPEGVRVCDRLKSLSGIVVEFYGFTELGFPSWELDPWEPERGPCPVPEPHVMTKDELLHPGVAEGFEAALVRLTDVTVGDHLVDCDHNGDGVVDFKNYDTGICNSECECRASCEADMLCTELNQYKEYYQWAVRVGGPGGAKIWIVSRDSIPEFDPFAPGHPQQISSITGTMRNMSFLRPQWILEPRCPADLVISGTPGPIGEACVAPRTGLEEEPN